MTARTIAATSVGCIAGFIAGWFRHPDDASLRRGSEGASAKIAGLESELQVKTAQVELFMASSRRPATDIQGLDIAEEEPEETKKMRDALRQRYADKQKLKTDEKMAVLRHRLNLTEAQAEKIRELLEKDPGGSSAVMARAMAGDGTNETEAMLEILRPNKSRTEMTEKIAAMLTPDHQHAYTAFRQEQRTNDVEVKATRDLARLQSSLTLTPEQKDKAFAALTKLADEDYDEPVSPMAAILQQQMNLSPHLDPAMNAHMEEIKAAADHAAQRRQARLDAMREVLAPEQLALYENQQDQSSFADLMDTALSEMPGDMLFGQSDAAGTPDAQPALR